MERMVTDRVREIMRRAKGRYGAMQGTYENGGWREHHRDISRYCLNRRNGYLESKDYDPNDGGKINQQINNGMPEEAIRTVSSGLMNSVTNPALPWIQITPEDEDLKDWKPVQEHLWRQLRTMYALLNQSNVYRSLTPFYDEGTAFATAALRLDWHPSRVFHAHQHTVGSFYLANGPDGEPDSCVYRYPRTVRQLVEEYGEDGVSKQTKDKWNAKSGGERDTTVKCVNLIEPNIDRDRSFLDWRGMRFRSITWEEDAGDDEPPLKIGGMPTFPVVTIRTGVVGEQVYGAYGSGMRMLPESRQLQKEEADITKGTGKMISPPLNVPHALRRPDGRMNGVNRYRGQRSDAIRPTYQVEFPYAEMRDTIDRRELKIQEISGASVFKTFSILDQTGNHQMTVPEVQERRAEAASLLGPLLRSVNDALRPMVELMWEHMERSGKIEPPPDELRGQKLRIDFVNALALEQSSVMTNAMLSYAGALGELDKSFPNHQPPSDNLDLDLIATELRQGYLVNPKIVLDESVVEETRQARAEAQAEQQRLEQEQIAAKTAKDLGGAPLGEGNALEAVAGV